MGPQTGAGSQRGNVDDAGVRSEGVPPPRVALGSQFSSGVERYPRKCQRKRRPAEVKAAVPMVESDG